MGFMTIAELEEEVIERTMRASAADFGDTAAEGMARVDRWLNWAILHVASPKVYLHRELQQEFSLTLATDDNTYATVPSSGTATSTFAVHSVRVFDPDNTRNGWRLEPIRDRDEFARQTLASGTPRLYSIWGASAELLLSPAPSSTYNGWTLEIRRIRYPKLITDGNSPLTSESASDVLEFQEPWDEVVVQGAVARAWRHLGEMARYSIEMNHFGQLVNEVADRMTIEFEDRDFGPEILLPVYQVP